MENLFIALIGSFLALDTTIAFQLLISQPLVACTIIGWLLGDVQMGLLIGFFLQLIWLSSMPVGAAVIPEGNIAAMITCVLIIRYHHDHRFYFTAFLFAFFYALVISYIGRELVILYRKINSNLLDYMRRAIDHQWLWIIGWIPIISITVHFMIMFLMIFLSLHLADFIFPVLRYLPPEWEEISKYGVIAIMGIGGGLVATMFKEKSGNFMIPVGIVLGAIIYFLTL